MPAIFNRSNDELIQILPSYSSSLYTEMKGKYVIDYPESFDLQRPFSQLDLSQAPLNVKNNVKSAIESKFREVFSQFEVYNFNYLETENEYNQLFDPLDNFPDPLSGAFLKSGSKSGDTPNSVCVLGRSPKQNTIEGGVVTVDDLSAENKCLVTLDVDITANTSDGLGRFDFLIYFKDALRKYTKDSTDCSKTPASYGLINRAGNIEYQTKKGNENFLRVYISGDNGNTYTELQNLTTFSFGQRKDSIRLAFVNNTDWDINLLTYTLMY